MLRPLIVAIDGPAGSGKSTVARQVAQALGVPHVDTGAYYRAATLAVLRAGADPDDAERATEIATDACISRTGGRTHLDDEDVENEIRGAAVTAAVSAVSRHPGVRRALLAAQRSGVGSAGAVVEGRDAGTVVVPQAALKVWLDAAPNERGRRRARQHGDSAAETVAAHVDAVTRRDDADAAQMQPAGDVVVLDTTDLTVAQVVARVVALAHQAAGQDGNP